MVVVGVIGLGMVAEADREADHRTVAVRAFADRTVDMNVEMLTDD